jgi:CheY-like chemotaxis protein
VHSDPALLERILRNLISNAIRYTADGVVQVACVPVEQELRIDVLDTGIGIPLEQQREIFKEFYQLDNPERDRNKGLGLGLAIVDRLSVLLEHPVEVQSTPGKGSRFSVWVPRGDPERVIAAVPPPVVSRPLAGLRVIVVDDEIAAREGMATVLEGWGCVVTLAGSEDEAAATAWASGTVPDAIIADYRLRDARTGVQAIERLQREFSRRIPALIVTGDTAAERLLEAKASGHQLVHKPVQPAMLRAFLQKACIGKPAS